MKLFTVVLAVGLVLLVLVSGCDWFDNGNGEDPVDPPPLPNPLPFELTEVTWLHTNVSNWAETSTLTVGLSGSQIIVNYDKATVWPPITTPNGKLSANPWIFVLKDGKWYAATWEWLRPGQTVKSKAAVNGDHIKQSPLKTWSPVVGETYYFMVSGLCRDHRRNAQERTNIVPMVWQ